MSSASEPVCGCRVYRRFRRWPSSTSNSSRSLVRVPPRLLQVPSGEKRVEHVHDLIDGVAAALSEEINQRREMAGPTGQTHQFPAFRCPNVFHLLRCGWIGGTSAGAGRDALRAKRPLGAAAR